MPKSRTYVVVRIAGGDQDGYIKILRIEAPRLDAAMVQVAGRQVFARQLVYVGNGVHTYTHERNNMTFTYYVADVEAMQSRNK